MTDQEKRNLAAVDRWIDTYNNQVDKMVNEVYAADCEVHNMFAGAVMHGREELRALEQKIQAQVPERRMELVKAVASGDTVAVEVTGVFGDERFPAVVFLTFNDAGQVVVDHSYAPQPSSVDVQPDA